MRLWTAESGFESLPPSHNPKTSFQNLAFSTSPSIASPNQGLGGALGAMLGQKAYLIAGSADANAVPTESGFDSFDAGKLFKHLEIGWTPSQDRIYLDNVHVTLWHAGERPAGGCPRAAAAPSRSPVSSTIG